MTLLRSAVSSFRKRMVGDTRVLSSHKRGIALMRDRIAYTARDDEVFSSNFQPSFP